MSREVREVLMLCFLVCISGWYFLSLYLGLFRELAVPLTNKQLFLRAFLVTFICILSFYFMSYPVLAAELPETGSSVSEDGPAGKDDPAGKDGPAGEDSPAGEDESVRLLDSGSGYFPSDDVASNIAGIRTDLYILVHVLIPVSCAVAVVILFCRWFARTFVRL